MADHIIVRLERAQDRTAADAVQAAAFPSLVERDLTVALRQGGHVESRACFVAEVGGGVVGHVVLSRATIGTAGVLGLGPIGVLPSHQGAGVGSALMHACLGAAEAIGHPVVGLLGSPDYYERFGFVASSVHGVEPPDPDWGIHFQIRAVGLDAVPSGRFGYAPPFDEL